MKGASVYLSGPMEHVSGEDGRGWRAEAKVLFTERGIGVFDPYDFEHERRSPHRLVREDLIYLLQAQAILINASQGVETWGTPMEVLWAWMHRIETVAFVGDASCSPWLEAHSSIVTTLDQGVDIITWTLSRL